MQVEEHAHHLVGRIDTQPDQHEQQPLRERVAELAAGPAAALAVGPTQTTFLGGIVSRGNILIQLLELLGGQSGHRAQGAGSLLQVSIGEHTLPILGA